MEEKTKLTVKEALECFLERNDELIGESWDHLIAQTVESHDEALAELRRAIQRQHPECRVLIREDGTERDTVEDDEPEHSREDVEAAFRTMSYYGGGFAKALATAWHHADSNNRGKIERAWPGMVEEYVGMARQLKAQGRMVVS